MIRTFEVRRDVDVSGISGTGLVAEGVLFSDGKCVTRWIDQAPMFEGTVTTWDRLTAAGVEKIHGHNGQTVLVWTNGCPHTTAIPLPCEACMQIPTPRVSS